MAGPGPLPTRVFRPRDTDLGGANGPFKSLLRDERMKIAPPIAEVFETADNPIPAEPIISVVQTRDGLRLRVARWSNQDARGTVTIATGRSEFIEQYFEVVRALLDRRFDVIVFDWRGQGLSDRELAERRRGHVSSFAAYHRDLLAIESQILRVFAPRPWFAFGHSMGAAILLDQAHDGTSPFERLILSAPMIDVPIRFKSAKRRVIELLDRLGFGTAFVPGGSARPMFLRGFDGNVLTGDRRRYWRLADAVAQRPEMVVGSPTIRWLSGAFGLMKRFEDPRYSVATLVPILIVAAGADRIVDTSAVERFAIRLKAGRCVTLPNARHQIFMEADAVIAQFWAAFDAFIPGSSAPGDAVTSRTETRRSGAARLVDRVAARFRRQAA